jgi:hypothetical protein
MAQVGPRPLWDITSSSRVANPDWGSSTLFTPGSGMSIFRIPGPESRIPNTYF